MPLAVKLWETTPPLIVSELVAGVALAPDEGAVKVITPPSTGSPWALLTLTIRGAAKGVLVRALWPLPPVYVSVKRRDS